MTRLIGLIASGLFCLPISSAAQDPRLTLRADVVIDGTGNTLRNTNIVVQGTKIQSIGQAAAQGSVYDLRGLTVMPGWIDTHAHISGHFDRKTGRLPEPGSETAQQTMLYTAGNAYRTLLAGFTTVQSPGAEVDKDLRDWIADRIVPGPRILTSLRAITDKTGTPEQIRAFVPQKFVGTIQGQPVCEFRQHFNPIVQKITLDFSIDTSGLLDRRLGLAAAVLLCAIEGRQGGEGVSFNFNAGG